MFSERFQRTVHITTHARKRMAERSIDEPLLLDLLETGTIKHKDAERLGVFKRYPDRADNVMRGDPAGRRVDRENRDAPFHGGVTMRTIYYEADDILEIHVSDKPIARKASQDWNTTISYAADGSVVEIVVLEASKQGAWPLTEAA